MLTSSSKYWQDYTRHVLKWEGKTSSDPRDTTAARCVSPGMIHTNKGVTYCTFREMAASLGITPVTHARFLRLTDQEVARFIFRFYDNVNGSKFPDSIAVAMVEAAWLSGKQRAEKHLLDALADLGQTVYTIADAQRAAKTVNEQKLFDAYVNRRWAYLIDYLGNSPKYAVFKNGWRNRLNDFKTKYRPGGGGAINSLIAAFFGLFFS